MLKKTISLLSLASILLTMSIQAANAVPKNTPIDHVSTREKDEIMKLDEADGTDTLAIPLDESEVEDDIQLDMDEHRPLKLDLPGQTNPNSQPQRPANPNGGSAAPANQNSMRR